MTPENQDANSGRGSDPGLLLAEIWYNNIKIMIEGGRLLLPLQKAYRLSK